MTKYYLWVVKFQVACRERELKYTLNAVSGCARFLIFEAYPNMYTFPDISGVLCQALLSPRPTLYHCSGTSQSSTRKNRAMHIPIRVASRVVL